MVVRCVQALLSLVLLMTSLVLGDGVLTPAQSGAPGHRANRHSAQLRGNGHLVACCNFWICMAD